MRTHNPHRRPNEVLACRVWIKQGRMAPVTKSEWLASSDPAAMLNYLCGYEIQEVPSGHMGQPVKRTSDRKLRLFACACCRSVWHLLADPRSRAAVEVAERYADGEAAWDELDLAWDQAHNAVIDAQHSLPVKAWALLHVAWRTADRMIARHMDSIAVDLPAECPSAALLREIIGNPWRPVLMLCGREPGWRIKEGLTVCCCNKCQEIKFSNDSRVLNMARSIYEERAWDRMPVLADALEDAGCPSDKPCRTCSGHGHFNKGNDDFNTCPEECAKYPETGTPCDGSGRVPNPLLAHLRSPGLHVRGCWALDILLGRK